MHNAQKKNNNDKCSRNIARMRMNIFSTARDKIDIFIHRRRYILGLHHDHSQGKRYKVE